MPHPHNHPTTQTITNTTEWRNLWCHACRKRRTFNITTLHPNTPHTHPNQTPHCTTCNTPNSDLFPGNTRPWTNPPNQKPNTKPTQTPQNP